MSHNETDDALTVAIREVDRCFAEEVPSRIKQYIRRDDVDVGVARWKRKNGYCRYNARLGSRRFNRRVTDYERARGYYSVVANPKIIEDSGVEDFLDTVRHELAHAIAYVDPQCGGRNTSPEHGPGWKQWARALDAQPTACDRKKDPEYEYKYGCPNGCWTAGRYRRSKKVTNPGRWHCTSCGDDCVSWEAGRGRPSEPGTCAVTLD